LLGTLSAGAAGCAGLGGLLRSAIAGEMKAKGKQVLFIWLDGGISQLESWDPKPCTEFGGPFRTIATSLPGVHISELLPKTAGHMHRLAVVRSMSTKDNSHSSGAFRIERGDPANRGVAYPFFGSAVAKLVGAGDSGLPPYISIRSADMGNLLHDDVESYEAAGFLGPQYGPLMFLDGQPPRNLLRPASVSQQDQDERTRLREQAARRYEQGRRSELAAAANHSFEAARTLMEKHHQLFDPARFPPRDVERYGASALGQHMLLARNLLEAGVTFVKVGSYGWDTHGDNFNGHISLVPKFDQAFAAVLEDLDERGMLEHVLVIAMSEFGRTPRINGHVGRDHWPEAWSLVMAGCGIKRGLVVGKTNDVGTFVDTDPYDIGHMFHTWFKALGIDSQNTQYTNRGQPLPIAHGECQAVSELLA
jgi:hypothetical protein